MEKSLFNKGGLRGIFIVNNMKKVLFFIIIILSIQFAGFANAQPVQQSFTLKPGWNTIFLEVQPENNRWDTILNGIPVTSVWTWNPGVSSVEYIQDPDTLLPKQEGWSAYLPNEPAILTNLYTAQGGKGYLVKLDSPQDVIWTVTGEPVMPKIKWRSDSFNFVGFHLDPGNEPFFKTFFDLSPAHQGQEIYRLGPTDRWERVLDPMTTRMKQGEAFWVYTKGYSNFVGPLIPTLEQGRGMDYGKVLLEQKIRFRTLIPNYPLSLTLTGDLPLKYWIDPPDLNAGWKPLSGVVNITSTANGDTELRLSADRTQMTMGTTAILEIKDGQGIRIRVPVMAEQIDYAGLWVGSVVVNKVQQPGESDLPASTFVEFQFRIIIHVDAGGTVRLVKEVTQMWDPNSKKLVLVSDNSQLSNYDGVALRNGQPVGRRVSSVNFGFEGARPMTGSLGTNLSITITIEPDDPTNPFLHRYHPDHNNLDERFQDPVNEAYRVIRDIRLEFTPSDPEFPEGALIGWGDKDIGGTYLETLKGLHKDDIDVAGTFRLHKVSSINELVISGN